MPSEILGLPLHPLVVHAPVVLVPLLSLVAIGYVLVPRVRPVTGWALAALAVVAPVVVFVARQSGEALADQQLADLAQSPDIAQQTSAAIDAHASNGTTLLWLSLAMLVLAPLFAGLVTGRLDSLRHERSLAPRAVDTAAPRRRAALVVVGALVIGLAAAMTFFVVRAGHTGAEMIWGA